MPHPAPDVVTALLDLLGPADADGIRTATAAGVAGSRVFHGPPLADPDDPDVIGIALSVLGGAEVLGNTRPTLAGQHHLEQFDITCLVQSWSGETDIGPRQDRVFEMYDAIVALLDADPQLGGRCMRARSARWTYRLEQTGEGAMAVIEFVVRVDARRF